MKDSFLWVLTLLGLSLTSKDWLFGMAETTTNEAVSAAVLGTRRWFWVLKIRLDGVPVLLSHHHQ